MSDERKCAACHTLITEKDRPVAYALRKLALEAEQLSGRLMDASDVVAELEKRELLGRAVVERQRQMLGARTALKEKNDG